MTPWVRWPCDALASPRYVQARTVGGEGVVTLALDGLSYCARYLTDGQIPAAAVRSLQAYSGAAVAALVAAGVWQQDGEGAVTVVDYLELQPPAAEVLQRRQDERARKAALRQRTRQPAPVVALAPSEPRRPAGPSDAQPAGPCCGVDWCDGRWHYSDDPDTSRRPTTRPCPRAQRRSA